MQTTDKARLTALVSPDVDEKFRALAFKHRKTTNISALTEAMILHCLSDRHFIKKLSLKKEEEYDI